MKNSNIYFTGAAFLMVLLLSACVVASGVVHTNAVVAPNAGLNKYNTYAWYQEQAQAQPSYDKGFSPNLDKHIRQAIEEELREKGFEKVTSRPDILVAYDMSVSVPEEKDKPENFSPGFGYSYAYMAGYRYNYSNSYITGYRNVDLFKQGTLIIDLVNPVNNQLVWRAWTEGAITKFDSGYKPVQKQVEAVLNKYPNR